MFDHKHIYKQFPDQSTRKNQEHHWLIKAISADLASILMNFRCLAELTMPSQTNS